MQMKDPAGKAMWSPVVSFSSKELRDKFSAGILDALREQHPEAFACLASRKDRCFAPEFLLGSRPPAGEEARPPQGVTEGRERHQDASERREGHTEGGGSGTVQRVKREMALAVVA
jgi:hypothetical protein